MIKFPSSHSRRRIRLKVSSGNTRQPTEVKPLPNRDRVPKKNKRKEK